MVTLIKNGYVVDPASGREGKLDLLIENVVIRSIRQSITQQEAAATAAGDALEVIDATGKYIFPGFIDLHVHLREPGFEYKETIRTGSLAAAAGGYTSICPMPNTKPAVDSPAIIRWLKDKAGQEAIVNILPIGAVTVGQEGRELCDIREMAKAGAIAISEDGKSVPDTALYAEGMRQAAVCGIPVFAHCEDKSLAGNGVINAGAKAKELKLPMICNAVEDIIAARDILLAKATGARLHLCHCSTMDSVKMIALAKEEGLPVTGEVCPHHFTLADTDIPADDADYKMNPPLRSPADVQAIKEALREGVIDVISTDHAPHSEKEKAKSMAEAPFGIVGLETAFALAVTELVKPGILSISELIRKMSVNPAKLIGIKRGCIGEGWTADLVIADLDEEYIIDKNKFFSKGRNTPFHGRKVSGRVLYTFVSGEKAYEYRS